MLRSFFEHIFGSRNVYGWIDCRCIYTLINRLIAESESVILNNFPILTWVVQQEKLLNHNYILI